MNYCVMLYNSCWDVFCLCLRVRVCVCYCVNVFVDVACDFLCDAVRGVVVFAFVSCVGVCFVTIVFLCVIRL